MDGRACVHRVVESDMTERLMHACIGSERLGCMLLYKGQREQSGKVGSGRSSLEARLGSEGGEGFGGLE